LQDFRYQPILSLQLLCFQQVFNKGILDRATLDISSCLRVRVRREKEGRLGEWLGVRREWLISLVAKPPLFSEFKISHALSQLIKMDQNLPARALKKDPNFLA